MHRSTRAAAARRRFDVEDSEDGVGPALDAEAVGWLSELLGKGGSAGRVTVTGLLTGWRAEDLYGGWEEARARVVAAGQIVALQIWTSLATASIPPELKGFTVSIYGEVTERAPPIADLLAQRFGPEAGYTAYTHASLLYLLAGKPLPPNLDLPEDAKKMAAYLQPHIASSKLHVPVLRRLISPASALASDGNAPSSPRTRQLYETARLHSLLQGLGIHEADLLDAVEAGLAAANSAVDAAAARLALLRSSSRLFAVAADVADVDAAVAAALSSAFLTTISQRALSTWRQCLRWADSALLVRMRAARASGGGRNADVDAGGSIALRGTPGRDAAESPVTGGGWSPASVQLASPASPGPVPAEGDGDESWLPPGLTSEAAALGSLAATVHWLQLLLACLHRRGLADDRGSVLRTSSFAGFASASDEERDTEEEVQLICAVLTLAGAVLRRAVSLATRLDSTQQERSTTAAEGASRQPGDEAPSSDSKKALEEPQEQLLSCSLACVQLCLPGVMQLMETMEGKRPHGRDDRDGRASPDAQSLLRRLVHAVMETVPALSQHALREGPLRAATLTCLQSSVTVMSVHADVLHMHLSPLLSSLPLEQLMHGLLQSVRGCRSQAQLHQELSATPCAHLVMGLLTQVASIPAALPLLHQLSIMPPALHLATLLCQCPPTPHESASTSDVSDASTETTAPLAIAAADTRAPDIIGLTRHTRRSAPSSQQTALALVPSGLGRQAGATQALLLQGRDAQRLVMAASAMHGVKGTLPAVAGYAADGARFLPAVMRQKALQLLGALLRCSAATESAAVSVLVTLEPYIVQPLQRFAALLTSSDTPGNAHLSQALLQECLTSLFLLTQLHRFRGAWLLHLPTSQQLLQQLLTDILSCVALLPTETSVVARLSSAPISPTERRTALQPAGGESEPPLKLRTGWFWTTATTADGPRREAEVATPPWSRWWADRSTRSRSLTASRTPTPPKQRRRSRSPQTHSPPLSLRAASPARVTSPTQARSPSPEPSASANMSFSDLHLSSALVSTDLGEDVEATCHSEGLAISIYDIAQYALWLLVSLSTAGAAEPSGTGSKLRISEPWPSEDVLLALQRQCLAVAVDLEQCEAHKGMGGSSAQRAASKAALLRVSSSILALLESTYQILQEMKKQVKGTQMQALAAARTSLHNILQR